MAMKPWSWFLTHNAKKRDLDAEAQAAERAAMAATMKRVATAARAELAAKGLLERALEAQRELRVRTGRAA